jgi:hypothetical protein
MLGLIIAAIKVLWGSSIVIMIALSFVTLVSGRARVGVFGPTGPTAPTRRNLVPANDW